MTTAYQDGKALVSTVIRTSVRCFFCTHVIDTALGRTTHPSSVHSLKSRFTFLATPLPSLFIFSFYPLFHDLSLFIPLPTTRNVTPIWTQVADSWWRWAQHVTAPFSIVCKPVDSDAMFRCGYRRCMRIRQTMEQWFYSVCLCPQYSTTLSPTVWRSVLLCLSSDWENDWLFYNVQAFEGKVREERSLWRRHVIPVNCTEWSVRLLQYTVRYSAVFFACLLTKGWVWTQTNCLIKGLACGLIQLSYSWVIEWYLKLL